MTRNSGLHGLILGLSRFILLVFALAGSLLAVARSGSPPPGEPPTPDHTVLLEGDADFDGDGRRGAAEDADGDHVFGTLAGIPGFAPTGPVIGPIYAYNHVVIVTSGVFFEPLRTSFATATTIEAAAGVRAVSDARGSETMPGQPIGAIALSADHRVVLRNLTFRHWHVGVEVLATASLFVDGCHFEDISDNRSSVTVPIGVRVSENATAVISGCSFTRCGDPSNSGGAAIRFEAGAKGVVKDTNAINNHGAGIIRNDPRVRVINSVVFGNTPNFSPTATAN